MTELHEMPSGQVKEMALLHWEPTGNVDVLRRSGTASGGVEKTSQPLTDTLSTQHASVDPIVLFLNAKKSPNAENASDTAALSSSFHIPKWLWRSKEQDSNGYFYGRTLASTNQSSTSKHVTVFRFMIKHVTRSVKKESSPIPDISYDWHILTFVTYWESGGKARLLCFNNPPELKVMIEQSLQDANIDDLKSHPFGFHSIILQHVAELYDRAIWQFRDPIRDTEKQRLTVQDPRPDYTAMHELARHVMHSSEVLSTALNVMDHILGELARWEGKQTVHVTEYDPGPDIRHQKSMLQFMHNRSQALEDRLKNEINLAFHITAQHSNQISAKIARAAQVDSRAMRTISILGLVFLPGTFISAIFSMSFFSFEQDTASWAVSEKIWLYWVVAIPVTALTIALWWVWQKRGESLIPEVGIVPRKKKEGC